MRLYLMTAAEGKETSMKKLYFGSNLKMYKTVRETAEYLKDLAEITKDMDREGMELFIIPSYK